MARFQTIIRVLFLSVLLLSPSFAQEPKENADFKVAVNLFQDHLYDLSLEQFRQFIATYPASARSIEARFYIAQTLRALERYSEARTVFHSFALTYPDHTQAPEAWWIEAELLKQEKKFLEAAQALERLKLSYPKHRRAPFALLNACECYEIAGMKDDAKKSLRTLLSEYPLHELVPRAHLHLGTLLFQESEYSKAKNELQHAGEGGAPLDIRLTAAFQLAQLAEATHHDQEAERLYGVIIGTKKNDSLRMVVADARYALGLLYVRQNNLPKALDQWNTIISDSSRLTASLIAKTSASLGEDHALSHQPQKAIKAFERSIRLSSDTTIMLKSLSALSRLSESSGDTVSAIMYYQRLASILPRGPMQQFAMIRNALLLTAKRQFENALQQWLILRELTDDDASLARILFEIGRIYQSKPGMSDRASEFFRELLSRFPASALADDASFYLALAIDTLGRTDEAIQLHNNFVSRYPVSPYVPRSLERKKYLETYAKGNREKAIEQLALLVGDVILDKPRTELAVRLGSIYSDVLQDYRQAERQYGEAATTVTDSVQRMGILYKQAIALSTLAHRDTLDRQRALQFLSDLQRQLPAGRESDRIAFEHLQLHIQGSDIPRRIESMSTYLGERPASFLAPHVCLQLGIALERKGSHSESRRQYERLLRHYPATPEAVEGKARLGLLIWKQGQVDSALALLTEFVESNPQHQLAADALAAIGLIQLENSNSQQAISAFQLIRKNFPYSGHVIDALMPLARAYREGLRHQESNATFLAALRELRSPFNSLVADSGEIFYNVGLNYEDLRALSTAREYYLRSLALPQSPEREADVWERLSMIFDSERNSAEAIRCLERAVAIQKKPNNIRKLADTYFIQGQFQSALAMYRVLLSDEQTDAMLAQTAQRRITVCLYRSDKRKEAEKTSADYLRLFRDDREAKAEFELEKALLLYRSDDLAGALAILRPFPKTHDSTVVLPIARFWIGKIYEATEELDSAQAQYLLLLRLFPSDDILKKTYLALGNIHFRREEYDQAITYYRLLVDKPDSAGSVLPFAMNNLIEAYKDVGLLDAAMELIRGFIERFPEDESVINKKIDLGVLYQKLGNYDQAIAQLQGLLEGAEKELEPEIRYSIGESYFGKGDYQQAVLEFLKVPYLVAQGSKIDWIPNSYYMAAQSYEKMSRPDQALQLYQQIIDRPGIDPSFKTAAQKELNRVRSIIRGN